MKNRFLTPSVLMMVLLVIQSFNFSAQIDLVSDLKVCMPFNGDATDMSGQGNNGIVTNATLTTDRFGNANSSYKFHRTSPTFISINSFGTIAPTNEITISLWAKPDYLTSNCLFILNPDAASDRCVGCAQYKNGLSTQMIWDYGDISSGGRMLVSNLANDTVHWHHYVYIVSQSANKKLMYIDGVVAANATYSLSCINKSLPLYIGGGFSNGTSATLGWDGKIDEVSIYNRALNFDEVGALYTFGNRCGTSTVGLNELQEFEKTRIFPTISSDGNYTIIKSTRKAEELSVFTIEGKFIRTMNLQEQNPSTSLDLSNFEKGIYLIKIIGEEGLTTQKIFRN